MLCVFVYRARERDCMRHRARKHKRSCTHFYVYYVALGILMLSCEFELLSTRGAVYLRIVR